jgi:hypothetical protein
MDQLPQYKSIRQPGVVVVLIHHDTWRTGRYARNDSCRNISPSRYQNKLKKMVVVPAATDFVGVFNPQNLCQIDDRNYPTHVAKNATDRRMSIGQFRKVDQIADNPATFRILTPNKVPPPCAPAPSVCRREELPAKSTLRGFILLSRPSAGPSC